MALTLPSSPTFSLVDVSDVRFTSVIHPRDGQVVARDTDISIASIAAVDVSGLSANPITVTGITGQTVVTDHYVVFIPDDPLAANTTYTVNIEAAAVAAFGAPSSFQFETNSDELFANAGSSWDLYNAEKYDHLEEHHQDRVTNNTSLSANMSEAGGVPGANYYDSPLGYVTLVHHLKLEGLIREFLHSAAKYSGDQIISNVTTGTSVTGGGLGRRCFSEGLFRLWEMGYREADCLNAMATMLNSSALRTGGIQYVDLDPFDLTEERLREMSYALELAILYERAGGEHTDALTQGINRIADRIVINMTNMLNHDYDNTGADAFGFQFTQPFIVTLGMSALYKYFKWLGRGLRDGRDTTSMRTQASFTSTLMVLATHFDEYMHDVHFDVIKIDRSLLTTGDTIVITASGNTYGGYSPTRTTTISSNFMGENIDFRYAMPKAQSDNLTYTVTLNGLPVAHLFEREFQATGIFTTGEVLTCSVAGGESFDHTVTSSNALRDYIDLRIGMPTPTSTGITVQRADTSSVTVVEKGYITMWVDDVGGSGGEWDESKTGSGGAPRYAMPFYSSGTPEISSDLCAMFLDLYAFLLEQTGDAQYRVKGDACLEGAAYKAGWQNSRQTNQQSVKAYSYVSVR